MANTNHTRSTNAFLFWLGTVGCLVIITVLLVTESIRAADERYYKNESVKTKQPELETGVECSVPDVFTASMEQYHESDCKIKLDTLLSAGINDTQKPTLYSPFNPDIPLKEPRNIERKDIIPDDVVKMMNERLAPDGLYKHDRALYWFVTAQLVIASVAYFCCVSLSVREWGFRWTSYAHFVTMVVISVAWLVTACLVYSHFTTDQAPLERNEVDLSTPRREHFKKGGVFMCDVKVRRLGNAHRYTHQCTYTVSLSHVTRPHVTAVSHATELLRFATVADIVLAFTLAALWFLHSLHMAIIMVTNSRHGRNNLKSTDDDELKPL